MRGLKIAIIGAGSTYMPELIDGFIQRKDVLKVDSFYLMDIDMPKTKIVGGLAERMVRKAGLDAKVVITDNLCEALEGADYVMGQVRVGKLAARIKDEKIPLKYNLLGQETTGIGGFMNGLRTIPVMMNVASEMQKRAPEAWLINFSNPSGIVAETLLNYTDVKMMGLCNAPIGMIKRICRTLDVPVERFDYDFIGLNHLSWMTEAYVDGKPMMAEILASALGGGSGLANIPSDMAYEPEMLKALRAYPSGYLEYFYHQDKMLEKAMKAERSRGEVCVDIEEELLRQYADPALDVKPEGLDKRGGAHYSEAAVSLVDAIENNKNELHVVNVRNNGALDFLAEGDVIEHKCLVNRRGATPVPVRGFDNQHIIGLIQAVKAYEKLAAKAGVTGEYATALEALLVHPLIGDATRAMGALNEMLLANRELLPQFADYFAQIGK